MRLILIICVCVLLGACFSFKQKKQEQEINSLYNGTLHGDAIGKFEERNLSITSKKEWEAFLLKSELTYVLTNDVNFSQEQLIIAIDSQKNTGGYSIEIIKIEEEKKRLLPLIQRIGPKPTDMVTMSLTQPIHIVKIPKTKKDIVFVKE